MSETRALDFHLGSCLTAVREQANLTQAQLAQRVKFSTASLSRIESGEKDATQDEISDILASIATTQSAKLSEFLSQDWDQIARPSFDHPSLAELWEANLALRSLSQLRSDPDLNGLFFRQIELYEKELRRVASFLSAREHQIACIGSIGVGKSTAICKMTGLLKSGEDKLDRQIVLETGAGGITLCEVTISQGPKYGLRIIPRPEDSIRKDVEDFCEYLVGVACPNESLSQTEEDDGDPLGISKEVVRAIRNMSGLTEKRKEENGRRVRIDPAKELALQYGNSQELCIHILTKMDLLRRNKRDAWYPDNSLQPPTHWLQQLFQDVNNGRHPEFTLPQKIEVILPHAIFDSNELPLRIIDTRGIDQTAEREDLECHFDDPRTLVVLCSRFNDAPEVALQNLLRRRKDAAVRDLSMKTVLLVLPRPDESLAVKHDDGVRVEDDVEGYELKRDQVRLRLSQQGLADISIEFFNARDESAGAIRDSLLNKILEYRHHYGEQVTWLSQAVQRLIENRDNEYIRLAFQHVSSDLNAWIQENRTIDLTSEGLEEALIEAIDGTRYASTVRAAVRRHGDWYNLDYYHQLATGVREIAVSQMGSKIELFNVIVNNLINNNDLSPAKDYLKGIQSTVSVSVDEAYQRLQVAGREAFKQTLDQDHEFWRRCDGEWGQGPGYRTRIRNMTDDEFQRNCDEAQTFVANLMVEEWSGIITVLEQLLEQTEEVATEA